VRDRLFGNPRDKDFAFRIAEEVFSANLKRRLDLVSAMIG
jgi:hypothetical protein